MSSSIITSNPSNYLSISQYTAADLSIKFDIDINLLLQKGKCGCLFTRKVRKHDPVVFDFDKKSFSLSKKGSSVEEHIKTAQFVAEVILHKCNNDKEKFDLVCKAIKLDLKDAHYISICQINKLKFLIDS